MSTIDKTVGTKYSELEALPDSSDPQARKVRRRKTKATWLSFKNGPIWLTDLRGSREINLSKQ